MAACDTTQSEPRVSVSLFSELNASTHSVCVCVRWKNRAASATIFRDIMCKRLNQMFQLPVALPLSSHTQQEKIPQL